MHRSWCLYCEYLCILKSNYLSYLLYLALRAWVIVLCFAWSPYRLLWKTEHKNYGVHVERIFLQNNPKSDEVKFQKKTLQSSNVQPFHSKNRLDEVNENKKHYRASLDLEHVNDVKRTFFSLNVKN